MIAGVVPAGGAGRRLGGVDKVALLVGGTSLLDRVLGAARPVCDRLLVVGPRRATGVDGVELVDEPDPGGGPAAAVGLAITIADDCEVVVVVAADLPFVTPAHLRRLLAALDTPGSPEAAAADDRRGPNPLLAAYRMEALRQRARRLGPGSAATGLLPPHPVLVDLGHATFNVNRPADLESARALAALFGDIASGP